MAFQLRKTAAKISLVTLSLFLISTNASFAHDDHHEETEYDEEMEHYHDHEEDMEHEHDEEDMEEEGDGGSYLMIGGNFLNIDALNTNLDSNGYERFSGNFVSYGLGGRTLIENFIIGLEGFWLWGHDNTSKDKKHTTNLSGAAAMLHTGYNVEFGNFSIYPLVGIGLGGVTLRVSEVTPFTFDEFLKSPGKTSEISSTSFLIDTALGLQYTIPFSEESKSGLSLGLRGGYIFAPFGAEWKSADLKAISGPVNPLTGPYVRFTIGG